MDETASTMDIGDCAVRTMGSGAYPCGNRVPVMLPPSLGHPVHPSRPLPRQGGMGCTVPPGWVPVSCLSRLLRPVGNDRRTPDGALPFLISYSFAAVPERTIGGYRTDIADLGFFSEISTLIAFSGIRMIFVTVVSAGSTVYFVPFRSAV